MALTLDEIRNQFKGHNPKLLNIVLEIAPWLNDLGFISESTKPGGTVKFVRHKGAKMLCSLQFWGDSYGIVGPFLFFKWPRNTMRCLGCYEEIEDCLFNKIKPIIHRNGYNSKQVVDTELRLFIVPNDDDVAIIAKIKGFLDPLVRVIAIKWDGIMCGRK